MFFESQQFTAAAGQNPFRLGHRFQHVQLQTRQLGVFLADVRPAFVRETDNNAVFGLGDFGHNFPPVSLSYASKYFALVLATTSSGNFGPGGVLFQSSVSR